MSKKKLFVLSMDAMVAEDADYLLSKPESNFSKLYRNGSGVRMMKTIYPSITYPAHVTMMTGCYPGKHGVFNNMEMTTEDTHPLWYLYSKSIKVDTIFTAAKRKGLTTAAVYWPVTGLNPDIDWIIDEYFFYKGEPIEETFRALGANDAAIRAVKENEKYFPVPEKRNLGGWFDDFIMGCSCSLIRNEKPDVLLVHNCLFDTLRHTYGIFNDKITESLWRFDAYLGKVIEAMKEAGTFEDTDFVVVSDHGQRNYYRKVHINALLRDGGFLVIDENNKVKDYRAFVQSNGMSAFIFLKYKNDKKTYNEVYAYLKKLSAENLWGFHEVFTEDETRERFGLYGDFSFMIESDNFSYCSPAWTYPVIENLDFSDYRYIRATHGYLPEKGPQPVFWATGPSFKENVVIEKSGIINEAPTLAATFGGVLPEADGHVLTELLK